MPIGVIFISSAAVLYTVAIWSERLKKALLLWMVIMLGSAFACDLAGTTIMWFRAIGKAIGIHGVFGYIALAVMLTHLIWAILAMRGVGPWALWFRRCSVYAWLFWLLTFFLGIPKVL